MAKQRAGTAQNLDLEKLDAEAEAAELKTGTGIMERAEALATSDDPALTPPPLAQAKPAADKIGIVELSITAPMLDVESSAYRPRHVNLQLNGVQADVMKRMLAALDQRGDRLQSGQRVQSAADAVRWLLEQVAVADMGN